MKIAHAIVRSGSMRHLNTDSISSAPASHLPVITEEDDALDLEQGDLSAAPVDINDARSLFREPLLPEGEQDDDDEADLERGPVTATVVTLSPSQISRLNPASMPIEPSATHNARAAPDFSPSVGGARNNLWRERAARTPTSNSVGNTAANSASDSSSPRYGSQ